MLYIFHNTLNQPANTVTRVTEWHVGEPQPGEVDTTSIESLQADGDELNHIKVRFTMGIPSKAGGVRTITIPMTNKKTMLWYGDTAKTIFVNLF